MAMLWKHLTRQGWCLELCVKHFRVVSACGYRKVSTTANRHTHTESEPPLYDVIISGGGMVGASMVAALGNEQLFQNKRILLLEAGPKKMHKEPGQKYSSRTCALSPKTRELLESFGAWKHIEECRYQPVKRMQVWDSSSDSMITFEKDHMLEDLAYIVENDIILSAIMKQVEEMERERKVEVKYESRAESYYFPSPGSVSRDLVSTTPWAQVHLDSGDILNTRLLIGADGGKSLVRETADIHKVGWDYHQFAVVATVKTSEPTENNVAWQRFLKTGPIALLPLSPEFSCLIWSTTTEDAKTLLQLSDDSFIDAVNNALWSDEAKDPAADYAFKLFDNFLGTVGLGTSGTVQQLPPMFIEVDEGSRAAFPLGLCHASEYVRTRLALIGDAAHRIHPMAGQGVNLGFGDVECLKDLLVRAIYNGRDVGSLTHLIEYETERQRHVVPTVFGVDGLSRLYNTDWTPAVLLRTLGLQVTNAIPPLKDMFMQHATN